MDLVAQEKNSQSLKKHLKKVAIEITYKKYPRKFVSLKTKIIKQWVVAQNFCIEHMNITEHAAEDHSTSDRREMRRWTSRQTFDIVPWMA